MIAMKPTNAVELDIVKPDKSETYPNEEGLIMNQVYADAGNDRQGDIMLNQYINKDLPLMENQVFYQNIDHSFLSRAKKNLQSK